jgi:hypothetical protein
LKGEGDAMKVAFEKYTKHLDINAWFKCVIIALGLIIVAWLIEASNALLFSSTESIWVKAIYYVGLTFIIGTIIWVILYISPKILQLVLSGKDKGTPPNQQSTTEENPQPTRVLPPKTESPPPGVQVRWIPVYPETPLSAKEETEAEKLRREFRSRGF